MILLFKVVILERKWEEASGLPRAVGVHVAARSSVCMGSTAAASHVFPHWLGHL